MTDAFLDIETPEELAAFLGMSYASLSQVIYRTGDRYKYTQFEIPKRGGGARTISAPSRRLKAIQAQLKDILEAVYKPKPSAQGFVRGRSIVTNARHHLNKTFVFNVDLRDFFGSIHFGRVKGLFQSAPFDFDASVAIVLAQICCLDNALPQGAPTSPVLANMIAHKMDAQMQYLAMRFHSTYTRYADDITFSFTCSQRRLPREIVSVDGGVVQCGERLVHVVETNGFSIHPGKVRLRGQSSRMEVTGLTVNEFPNVNRYYVRQIQSMLYAWRTHGYEAAEREFNQKYDAGHRPSCSPKSLEKVVRGKLAFLSSVRGPDDSLFNKLAAQYNDLQGNQGFHFRITPPIKPDAEAVEALWVLETCYDRDGDAVIVTGTGFMLSGVGLVTCAHCVLDEEGSPHQDTTAYQHADHTRKFKVVVRSSDRRRDIAVCDLVSSDGGPRNFATVSLSDVPVAHNLRLTILGYPNHRVGMPHYAAEVIVARPYTQSGVHKFDINLTIGKGNSGGPLVDVNGRVAGMALEGTVDSTGVNAALSHEEIRTYLREI